MKKEEAEMGEKKTTVWVATEYGIEEVEAESVERIGDFTVLNRAMALPVEQVCETRESAVRSANCQAAQAIQVSLERARKQAREALNSYLKAAETRRYAEQELEQAKADSQFVADSLHRLDEEGVLLVEVHPTGSRLKRSGLRSSSGFLRKAEVRSLRSVLEQKRNDAELCYEEKSEYSGDLDMDE